MSAPQFRISISSVVAVVVVVCSMASFCSVIIAGDLTGSDLAHANYRGQDLRGVDLTNADLTMADFSGADLRGANLTGARLDRINLDRADLRGVIGWAKADLGLGISANDADFSSTDLRTAKVMGGYSGGYFERANFTGADLTDATLAGRFHKAEFHGAVLNGTIMLGAAGIDSIRDGLRHRGAIVIAEDLAAAVKSGRDFSHYLLRGTQLQDVDLTNVQLAGADLHSARLDRSLFTNGNLRGARLYFATAEQTRFDRADLSQSRFDNVNAAGASFVGARLVAASLQGTDLSGADLRNADLTSADLSFANIAGADLTGATIDGVTVVAAVIQDVRGLHPDMERMLKKRAGRRWYDFKISLNGFLQDWSLPAHLVITPIAIILGAIGGRGDRARRSYAIISGMNVAAAAPLVIRVVIALGGGSPTAQLSMPGLWQVWFHLWPVMMLGLGVLCLGSLAAGGYLGVRCVLMPPRHRPILSLCLGLLTTANCLFATQVLLMMAPDA